MNIEARIRTLKKLLENVELSYKDAQSFCTITIYIANMNAAKTMDVTRAIQTVFGTQTRKIFLANGKLTVSIDKKPFAKGQTCTKLLVKELCYN